MSHMFLSNDLTHCNRDGYGSMSNLLRASVSLALHYNLTYVHHPLRCSHGVDWRVLDRWFDYGHGAPCDAACIDSAVASGGLREASLLLWLSRWGHQVPGGQPTPHVPQP